MLSRKSDRVPPQAPFLRRGGCSTPFGADRCVRAEAALAHPGPRSAGAEHGAPGVGEEGERGGRGAGARRLAADEGDGGFAVFVPGDRRIELAVAVELAAAGVVGVDAEAAGDAAGGGERPVVPA